MIKKILATSGALVASSSTAFAHLEATTTGSFSAGFAHPLFGMDHLLVMLVVGLWAAQGGKRTLIALPASFVAMMIVGFGLALGGFGLPFVEPVILSSVVGLGLLVALAIRLPVWGCAGIVGAFALFHGHAHGSEMGTSTAFAYGAGFVIATIQLHLIGWGIGRLAKGSRSSDHPMGQMVSRFLGGVAAVAGAALILA